MTRRHNQDDPCDAIVASAVPNAPGQRREKCRHCDGDMWLSPSSQKRLDSNPNIDLICLTCLLTKPELRQGAVVSAPSDEVLRSDLRGDPVADKIIAALKADEQ